MPKSPVGLEAIIARGPQHGTPQHLLTRAEELPVQLLGQQPIKYDDWMETTKLAWNQPRSSRLKAIDKALKAFEEDPSSSKKATTLRTAINDWIRWKGPTTWKQSKRNADGIVERLRVYAFAPDLPTPMTPEEVQAWQVVEKKRRQALQTLFGDKQVQLKVVGRLLQGATAARNAKTAARNLKQTVNVLQGTVTTSTHHAPQLGRGPAAMSEAGRATRTFIEEDLLDFKNLGPDTIRMIKDHIPVDEIVADFIPLVNIVTGGIGLIVKWGKVAKAAHAVYSTENSRYVIELGDPQKAFDGVKACLKRDRTTKALQASQATAKFAVQTAGTFAGVSAVAIGPATAAANAAATLAHKLFIFGREVKEVGEANKILRDSDNLDFRLFEKYPLAGCYMIRCATLSDIVCMSTVQFGNPGWMDDIELMKKNYIDPLRAHCDRFIKESFFEIPRMPLQPMKK